MDVCHQRRTYPISRLFALRPGLLYYDTPVHLITLARSLASNETWRHTISKSQKRFFRREQARTEKHVRNGLSRALIAARQMRAASRDATAAHF